MLGGSGDNGGGSLPNADPSQGAGADMSDADFLAMLDG